MSKVLHDFTGGLRRSQPLPIIKLVMFYENRALALRAKNVLDRIASAFFDEFIFTNEVWSFDTLRFSELRENALHEAAEADLVAISIRNDVHVAREILHGLGTWHRHEDGHSPAAIILWDRTGQSGAEIAREQALLKAVAFQKGIELLLEGSDSTDGGIDGEIGKKCRSRSFGSVSSEFIDVASHPALDMHWGINE